MIDGRLPPTWPEAVLEASRLWRQGYVVEAPPYFYYRSEANPVWHMEVDPPEQPIESDLVELEASERPPYGMVTTQTCDLFEEGQRPKQPWFAVAPVYDYSERLRDGQLTQLRRGDFSHLVLLTATWLPAGHWVADLRIEVPLEKGWLVGREPRDGFNRPQEYQRLATRLASRRGRPALSSQLSAALARPLRDWLNEGGRASRDRIASFRLKPVGDPATSSQAELLVILEDNGLTDQMREAWHGWESDCIKAAEEEGVLLFPFRYGTWDEFTARDVDTSLRLDFDHLSPD